MKMSVLFMLAILGLLPAQAKPTVEQRYLAIYTLINVAESAERKGDWAGALRGFWGCYLDLVKLRADEPNWHPALVEHRLSDFKAKIMDLSGKLAEAGKTSPPPPHYFHFVDSKPAARTNYSWKTYISATMFWIGERGTSNSATTNGTSAWDQDWVRENQGEDSPDGRNGYAAGEHASTLNPFYVALPFNDLAFPEKAHQWLPPGWAREPRNGKPVSACKDRWLEIKNGEGRVCLAQWEDVGPGGDDAAEYVFGPGRPPAGKPGICVAPAVAQYLGLQDDGKAVVSWRFVDDADVRPGPWLKYDEQAVIFLALHEAETTER